MAEVKISDLTAAVSVAGVDLIPVVQGGVTKKATASLAPVSTAQQTALDLKANLAGPTFTGTVTLPNSQALVTPVLGTPTSGTLTNCTGLPVAGITASTATALGVGSIELGHATANTLTGSGGVLSVEGVAVPTISSTNTLTNKRITKRTGTTTSSGTPSIDSDTIDIYSITALAVAITSLTITGTPTEGQSLALWIKDNGGAQTITFGTTSQVASTDSPFPTTTVAGKYLYCTFIYNTVITKWVMSGILNNI